nr:hypothetical protein [Tanacetum cinerariifolium]
GGRVEGYGTIPVFVCAQEVAGERGGLLAGKSGKGYCLVGWSFGPSGDFEIFTLLVPGLWLLSFEGLGFDLLARLVSRL